MVPWRKKKPPGSIPKKGWDSTLQTGGQLVSIFHKGKIYLEI